MSYFFGTYPSEKRISRLFDLARLIVQPDYARRAHITLRGPYDKKPSPRSRWYRQKLSIGTLTRPNTFFNENQSTVYLGVHFIELNEVSWKRDFSDGVPHMTIYDGDDRRFAWQVLDVMRQFPWQIRIELTPVQVLERKRDYDQSFFLELDDIDIAFSYIQQRPLDRRYIREMHLGQRLFLLKKILEELNSPLNHPSSTPR